MFVSKPDPKWQGSEDKRRGLPVKWWVFFTPSLLPPPSSLITFLPLQICHPLHVWTVCVCWWVHVCVRARRSWGKMLESNYLRLSVSDLNLTGSRRNSSERERDRMRGWDEGEGCTKEWRGGERKDPVGDWERERKLRERESWGRDGCLCVLVVVQGSGSFSRFEKRGWNKFKVLLKRSSVHIKIPNCPQTHELLEWTPYLLSAVVTIIQFEGHLFFDVTLISAAAQKRVIRVKSIRRFIGCTEGCQKRTQLCFQTRLQNTVAEVQHINNKYLHISVREITSGGKKQRTNTLYRCFDYSGIFSLI